MSEDELVKTLECCMKAKCDDCPAYIKEIQSCKEIPIFDIAVLINRLKAKIKELESEVSILTDANKNLKELYQEEKEIAEAAKQKAINICKKIIARTDAGENKPISRAVHSEWYLNYDYLFDRIISLYKSSKGEAHQAYSEVIDIIFHMVISTINTTKSEEAENE